MLREEDEIQEARDLAATVACKPSVISGQSYEEGVRDALEWVLGQYGDGTDPIIEKERYGL